MTIEEKKKKKGDRCVRIAKRKYDVWPCVPMHSEALTKTGWKKYKEISVGDTILAYDPDSDTLKWTLVKNLHFYENAKTIKMDKQHFQITSTPDHKWVTYNKNSGFKRVVNEQKLSKILETINEVNEGKINKKEAQKKLPSFFHYYKKYNGKTQEEIIKEARISKGGIDFTKTKNLKRSMCILTAARLDGCYKPLQIESISKYGDNWVEKILNMSADQVDAFFASAIIYDGNQKTDLLLEKNTGTRKTENTYGFKQKDEMHGDIFELAAFLSGRNVTRGKKNQYGITSFYVRDKRYIPLDVMRFSEDEEQDVWCPETEFGTWVMRQNNRILITGNSAYASGAVVKCRQGKIWKGLKEEELNEVIDEEISKELSQLAKSDQELRNIWAQWLDQKGGWSEELIDEFSKKYGTTKEDLFNDAPTQEEFKNLFSMMSDEDYKKFSEDDWDNFHILVQHMDKNIEVQKKAREILKKFNRTEQYKYLDDRINCAEFGKQLYGTQNGCELVDTLEEKKKPDFKKEKESGLHGWFSRQGGKGKSKGWVDCNTCRTDKKTGKKTCKTCGRKEGEKRSKYPACRPKPSDCDSSGKGKDWGKRSAKKESLQIDESLIEEILIQILQEIL